MKKILIILCAVFICGAAIAQTIRWHIGDTVYETTTCNAGESITPPTAPEKFGYSFSEWEVLYTRIEYLESTGTQWIDTGTVVFGTNSYIKFGIDYYPINNNCFMGANGATQLRISYMASGIKQNAYSLYDVKTGNNKNVVNGTIKESAGQSSQGDKLLLFSLGGYGSYCVGRLYSSQIVKDDVLVRDFIPVLDKNGTPCMYDKVEGKFYYNAGTGQFIAGPVIGE